MRLTHNLPPWTLNVVKCPCDLHFLRYLSRKALNRQTIFHFGTGEHHLIGRENVRFEYPNEILGITASRGEYDRYMDLVVDNPPIGRYYKVLFMDIYTINPRLMPKFDLITMFHLSEHGSGCDEGVHKEADSILLEQVVSLLQPGGRILFYKNAGRAAAERVQVLLSDFCNRGRLQHYEDFESLLVYRPCGG
jgi:hypothetical protein